MTGNLRRDMEVADSQVDHVGEALEATITGSSILDDFDNTVEALTDGVGKVSVDEGEDVIEVIAQGCDELAQRRDTAAQCGGDPAPEELLRRAPVGIIPEVFKLVLEHPGAVDTAVGVAQAVEKAGMALGAISGVHAKQPAQPLDRLAAFGIEGAPLLLAHLVHGFVQGLDDVEAVDDQRGVGTVMLDRLGVGAAHIATGPQNARFLPLAQALIEEPVNALSALALADPQDPGAVQIIDQGGELAALAEGDLVDAQGGYTADFMAVSYPVDDPVQQVRECRGRHTQDLGGGLLGHDLAQGTEAPLQAVADARIGIRQGMVSCTRAWVGQRISLGVYQSSTFRPMRVRSSQRRGAAACHTIRPRRPQCGQRQPFLYGLTARCSSLSRCLKSKRVIFMPFRCRILHSNFRLLTGLSSFSSTPINRGNETRAFV